MILSLLFIAAGLFILVKGADWLVTGAASIARAMSVPQLTIGLTVVAFGTSLPELTVNIFSSINNANDIAFGNIVGSNIANILLILGIAAVIAPLSVKTSTVWKEIPFSLMAAFIIMAQVNDLYLDRAAEGAVSRADGIVLLFFFAVFMWYTFGMPPEEYKAEDGSEYTKGIFASCGYIIAGLALLILGGKLTVDGAIKAAELIGISQAFIGLTIVAVGTSLPELATSAVAAKKGNADIAVGNVVGSNIFNIFWILGVSSIVRPIGFQPYMNLDLLVLVITTLVLFWFTHTGGTKRLTFWKQKTGHDITRLEGAGMIAMYTVYIGFLVWRG